MVATIYQTSPSPPCRAVLLTAKVLRAPIIVKDVDLFNGGTNTEEFIKLNPQHCVPTMVDNGLVLAESRAIMEYLSDAYGRTDSLYPKNTKKRAVVSSRMYFDATTLMPRLAAAYLVPIFRGGERTESSLVQLDEALAILDSLIGDDALYLAGDQLTIADITTVVTVSTLEGFGHDISKFKNVNRWLQNAKKVITGYEEINQKQIDWINQWRQQKEAERS